MACSRILIVSFGHVPGGFSRVAHSLAEQFARSADVHFLAINIESVPEHDYPWTLYCKDAGDHATGFSTLERLADSLEPDVVWILNDFWFLATYRNTIPKLPEKTRVVAYLPLDGRIVHLPFLTGLQFFDHVAVYCEFARAELADAFERLACEFPEFRAPPLSIVPHGVDVRKFYPLDGFDNSPGGDESRRALARAKFFGDEMPSDAFLVLNANQNHSRKRLDLTIRGFALFAAKCPTARLHLHCATLPQHPSAGGFDLAQIVREEGVEDLVTFSRDDGKCPELSDNKLNLLYNAANVGINSSWGEGWGLVSFEHAATGAVQVVPDHSACSTLWRGSARMLEIVESEPAGFLEACHSSKEAVAQALNDLFLDPSATRDIALLGAELATHNENEWSASAATFMQIFESIVLDHLPASPGKL